MQPMDTNWQISEQPGVVAGFGMNKELKLKLSLETRNRGDVIIVHCQGRIVYRDEAAAPVAGGRYGPATCAQAGTRPEWGQFNG